MFSKVLMEMAAPSRLPHSATAVDTGRVAKCPVRSRAAVAHTASPQDTSGAERVATSEDEGRSAAPPSFPSLLSVSLTREESNPDEIFKSRSVSSSLPCSVCLCVYHLPSTLATKREEPERYGGGRTVGGGGKREKTGGASRVPSTTCGSGVTFDASWSSVWSSWCP